MRHESLEDRLQTLQYLLRKADIDMNNSADAWRFKDLHGNELLQSAEYWKGYISAAARFIYDNFKNLTSELEWQEIHNAFFIKPTRRQKDRFTVVTVGVADDMTVAINHIYGIKVKEGDTIRNVERPWALFKVQNRFGDWQYFGIYSDDPGQQDYARFGDETRGFGSYNFFWEDTCIYEYIYYLANKYRKQIDEYIAARRANGTFDF